jgi:hypothetical protein
MLSCEVRGRGAVAPESQDLEAVIVERFGRRHGFIRDQHGLGG